MNFTSGLPVAAIAAALTWYGESSLMRSAQTSSGSPIETQTSLSRTSQPLTASESTSRHRDLRAGLVRDGAREVDDFRSRP